MANIPEPVHEHTTAQSIVRWYEKQSNEPRPHLGFSEIGNPCKRALYYGFHWTTKREFEGRLLRLFGTGHREESRFIEELKGIGVEVYDTDPDTGTQHRFVSYKGHFAGSCDAIGRGFPEAPKTWAIGEFKTHNDKSFNDLVKNGVKKSKPAHWAQAQMYMGESELDRTVYLAVNKNNDDVYSEWIKFDRAEYESLVAKAVAVIDAEEPPEKMSTDPAWYECKFCNHHAVCHADRVPEKNCRTCLHATPVEDGAWHCDKYNRLLPVDEQRIGCRAHLYLPPLITYASAEDAGDGWVKYVDKQSGTVFANVTEDCDRSENNMTQDITICLTSAEMMVATRGLIADSFVAAIKQEFPGSRITATTEEAPF